MARPTVLRLILLGAAIAMLECACRAGWIAATVIVPPSVMVASLFALLARGEVFKDILTSFGNAGAAALLAIVAGFAIGNILHALPRVRHALEPYIASYYAVPTFMFYPVFIILFGVGNAAIIAISVILAIVSMITATLTGLDRVPPVLRKTARIMRLGRFEAAVRISLPASLPYLFTGVKLSVAYALIGVIASEFILSSSGLGYSIAYDYNNFDTADMYALMLLIILVVSTINAALDAVDRRLQERIARS